VAIEDDGAELPGDFDPNTAAQAFRCHRSPPLPSNRALTRSKTVGAGNSPRNGTVPTRAG